MTEFSVYSYTTLVSPQLTEISPPQQVKSNTPSAAAEQSSPGPQLFSESPPPYPANQQYPAPLEGGLTETELKYPHQPLHPATLQGGLTEPGSMQGQFPPAPQTASMQPTVRTLKYYETSV